MPQVLFVAITINLLLFATLAAWAVRYALREELPRMRPLAWALAAVAGAFVLGGITRLLLVLTELGWLDVRVDSLVVSEWHVAQSAASTALGLTGLVIAHRVGTELRKADLIVATLSDRMPAGTNVELMGLTVREKEVLAVIVAGKMSDQDIADELYIAPATAGTHIRNILRKTGMRSRRDLALLALSQVD